jgi:hypothetical protein
MSLASSQTHVNGIKEEEEVKKLFAVPPTEGEWLQRLSGQWLQHFPSKKNQQRT